MKKPLLQQRYAPEYKLIFDNLDFTAHGIDPETEEAKIKALYDTFMQEKGEWRAPQIGKQKALVEWLQGLPSVLTLPFYNSDILAWGRANGKNLSTEKKEEKFIETYWAYMAMRLIGLFRYCEIPGY